MGSPMTPFASLTRASVLYTAAGFLPVIGWFGLLPLALFLAVGSGVAVLGARKEACSRSLSANVSPWRQWHENVAPRHLLGLGAATLAGGLLSGCESLEQRWTKAALPSDPCRPICRPCRLPSAC